MGSGVNWLCTMSSFQDPHWKSSPYRDQTPHVLGKAPYSICFRVLQHLLKQNICQVSCNGAGKNSVGMSPVERNSKYLEQINTFSLFSAVNRSLSFIWAQNFPAKDNMCQPHLQLGVAMHFSSFNRSLVKMYLSRQGVLPPLSFCLPYN